MVTDSKLYSMLSKSVSVYEAAKRLYMVTGDVKLVATFLYGLGYAEYDALAEALSARVDGKKCYSCGSLDPNVVTVDGVLYCHNCEQIIFGVIP